MLSRARHHRHCRPTADDLLYCQPLLPDGGPQRERSHLHRRDVVDHVECRSRDDRWDRVDRCVLRGRRRLRGGGLGRQRPGGHRLIDRCPRGGDALPRLRAGSCRVLMLRVTVRRRRHYGHVAYAGGCFQVRYGIDVASLGEWAEPSIVVDAAQAAEAAGWDAVLLWDHLGYVWGAPAADPWVVMAAVAQATVRLRLGTAVTPLPRRRPAVVAGAVATLDRLSGGRVIFGAGAGGLPSEFTAFGESGEASDRAAMLDEGLDVLAGLWSGEPVIHSGTFYQVDGVTLAPLPVQRPRPPVWIGGTSRGALRRAARWDGWIIGCDDEQGTMVVPPASIAADAAVIAASRSAQGQFDIAVMGSSAGPGDAVASAYAEAGATWWLEHIHGRRGSRASMFARIGAGPPR